MKYKTGTFITVPNKQALAEIDSISQAVFLWLCGHANDEGKCFPSVRRLADLTSASKNTVTSRIKKLQSLGFIRVTRRRIPGKKEFASNLYTVLELESTSRNESRRSMAEVPVDQETVSNSIYLEGKTQNRGNKLAAEVIRAFEEVDPKNKTYYSNKTQLIVAESLIEEHGLERVLEVIKILPITNKKTYFPSIHSAYELNAKWTQLLNALQREKGRQSQRGRGFA